MNLELTTASTVTINNAITCTTFGCIKATSAATVNYNKLIPKVGTSISSDYIIVGSNTAVVIQLSLASATDTIVVGTAIFSSTDNTKTISASYTFSSTSSPVITMTTL